jgi:hypothetical protein
VVQLLTLAVALVVGVAAVRQAYQDRSRRRLAHQDSTTISTAGHLRLSPGTGLGAAGRAATDQGHRDGDSCHHARSQMDQEHAE